MDHKAFMPNSDIIVPDSGLSLAHAIVSSSDAPLLLLDNDLGIIAASEAFAPRSISIMHRFSARS